MKLSIPCRGSYAYCLSYPPLFDVTGIPGSLVWDPIPTLLHQSLITTGPHLVGDLAGVYSTSPLSLELEHIQDDENKTSLGSTSDLQAYGGIMSSIAMFLGVLGLGSVQNPDTSNEHGTYHSSWRGRAVGGAKPDRLVETSEASYSSNPGFFGVNVMRSTPPKGVQPSSFVYHKVDDHDYFTGVMVGASWQIPTIENMLKALLAFQHAGSWYGYPVYSWDYGGDPAIFLARCETSFSDLTFASGSDGSLVIAYQLWTKWGDPPFRPYGYDLSWGYHCSIKIQPSLTVPDYKVSLNDQDPCTYFNHVNIGLTYDAKCFSASGHDQGLRSWMVKVGDSFSRSANQAGQALYPCDVLNMDGFAPSSVLVNLASRDYQGHFRDAVYSRMHDLRASASIAASKALDDGISVIAGDIIQTLVKLDGISDILPDLRQGIKLLRELHGGVDFTTLRELVKFASSEYLRNRYTQMPDVALVVDVLPKMSRTLQRVYNLRTQNILGYGSFTYDFPPGEFGRESSKLLTRTKLVAGPLPNDTVASILGLKSVGLLPSPLVIWDLIPYSFAINWLFSIADRMRVLEGSLALTLLDIRCFVHSYLVTSPVTEAELDACELRDVGLPPLSHRVYVREVSQYIPVPYFGKYDFFVPGRVPSWLLPAALVLSR